MAILRSFILDSMLIVSTHGLWNAILSIIYGAEVTWALFCFILGYFIILLKAQG